MDVTELQETKLLFYPCRILKDQKDLRPLYYKTLQTSLVRMIRFFHSMILN